MAIENRPALLSYADYARLPFEGPGEVIHGELVMGPSPFSDHQEVVGALYARMRVFLDDHPGLGRAFVAPLDVVLRAERPAIVVQPDVLFIRAERMGIVERVVMGPPDLAVEVVSAGNSRHDAVVKLGIYAEYGIPEFWLVWPQERRVDVFTLAEGSYGQPRMLTSEDALTTPTLPGFTLPVRTIFASVTGEAKA